MDGTKGKSKNLNANTGAKRKATQIQKGSSSREGHKDH